MIDLSFGVEQEAQSEEVAAERGLVQRSLALLVLGVEVGIAVDDALQDREQLLTIVVGRSIDASEEVEDVVL